jgi:MbnP
MQNKIRYIIILAAFVTTSVLTTSCDDDPPPIEQNEHKITVTLNHQWDGSALSLNDWYITANFDSFQLTKIVYHINNFEFIDADGSALPADDDWFMVNGEESLMPVWTMGNLDDRIFTSVRFTIGVSDSAVNASGELNSIFTDPMFWGMANGYINFKLEGKSPSVTNEDVTLHTGGYLEPYRVIANVEVEFPTGSEVSSVLGSNLLTLNMNLAEYFDNPNLIDLSTTFDIQNPNDDAVKISENWPSMYSFGSVR